MARGVNKVLLAGKELTPDQVSAFWSKVNITHSPADCWEWEGAKKPTGYGNVRINKQYFLAHRVAFELYNKVEPGSLLVCHVCDNPSCCNPNHLMLGTVKSNAADMLIKNRQKKQSLSIQGSKNHNAKLTESEAVEIRKSYGRKEMNQYQLAAKYGISQTAIGSIIRRATWSHI